MDFGKRNWSNSQSHEVGNVIFSFSTLIESPRSFFYAYYHSYYTALKNYYDFDMTNLNELSIDRSSKEVAAAQITALSYTPTTPFNQRRGCYLNETWTPSAFPSLDESSEMQSLESESLETPWDVVLWQQDHSGIILKINPPQSGGGLEPLFNFFKEKQHGVKALILFFLLAKYWSEWSERHAVYI